MNPLTIGLLNALRNDLERETQATVERALEMGIGYAVDVLKDLDDGERKDMLEYSNRHAFVSGLRNILANGRAGAVLEEATNMARGIIQKSRLDRLKLEEDRNRQEYLNTSMDVTVNYVRKGTAFLTISDPTAGTYDAQLVYKDRDALLEAMSDSLFESEWDSDNQQWKTKSFVGRKTRLTRWLALDLIETKHLIGPESMLPINADDDHLTGEAGVGHSR